MPNYSPGPVALSVLMMPPLVLRSRQRRRSVRETAPNRVDAGSRPPPRKPSNSVDAYLALRREARDRDDESLLEAIRETPEGPIGGWAEAIGKSRSSVVAALHRLRDAGLADSVEGKWTLVEEPAPRVAAPKWVAPLSAAGHAHV